jgi:eukaryotic-like serine/threonine-protein kinase
MKSVSLCKSNSIEQYLSDSLPQSEWKDLELHLSHCEACQEKFEHQLASISIEDSVSLLLASESTLQPESQRRKNNKLDKQWDRESILELSKQILPRSDNPAMIGKLGEFEILEPLGVGGMGIVYKGYDHELNRFVAVKVLSPTLSVSGAAKQRFLREAQAAAAVVHPNVVPIHAVSSDGQIPYLVMSYIPGTNLQEHLDTQGALSPVEAMRIGHQVALGLAVAHQQGVIHRDIKPGNIMLERNVHRALLTDFGLARAMDDASLTQSGTMAGTPNYMSPEQAKGELVDARSDLFGLGCVLYTMLAGHPPFRGEHPFVVLRRLVDEQPRALTMIQPHIPVWMDRLVMKLLDKDRETRIQSAAQVAELLNACILHLEHPSVHPLPESLALIQDQSTMKRSYSKTISMAAVLLVASGLAVVATYSKFSEPNQTMEPSMKPSVMPVDWLEREQKMEAELQDIERQISQLEIE